VSTATFKLGAGNLVIRPSSAARWPILLAESRRYQNGSII
jgi:hypothetical protein